MTSIQPSLTTFRTFLRRIAWPAEQQVRYLTDLGVAPSLDELALEFNDLYRPLERQLGALSNATEVLEVCRAIDTAFSSETLGWRFDDLNTSQWVDIRRLAARADVLLNV